VDVAVGLEVAVGLDVSVGVEVAVGVDVGAGSEVDVGVGLDVSVGVGFTFPGGVFVCPGGVGFAFFAGDAASWAATGWAAAGSASCVAASAAGTNSAVIARPTAARVVLERNGGTSEGSVLWVRYECGNLPTAANREAPVSPHGQGSSQGVVSSHRLANQSLANQSPQ
jgi:hypothetical protein